LLFLGLKAKERKYSMQVKITVSLLQQFKLQHRKISTLTAYDYPMAKILDEAGVDIILVGDSLGNVILGYENTLPVTLKDMLHHTKAVRRAVTHALLVVDMPVNTYEENPEEAAKNALKLADAGAEALKLEGAKCLSSIQAILKKGIPVMGHLGFTPQSVKQLGGYKVQGKDKISAQRIFEEAKSLEGAGVFAIVLEMIPPDLAEKITRALKIPTIGIGAGDKCDGQVLVTHDLLGLTVGKVPSFVKPRANLKEIIRAAVKEFREEIYGAGSLI
jgi:3-methyl-2-oxobutanoate hydroxymethyltransferase